MKKYFLVGSLVFFVSTFSALAASPSVYTGYTGTDVKVPPAPPALGPANSILNDPQFGSRILRVTDANTAAGQSFIPADAGFTRTFNADSTAIKMEDEHGFGYWEEFNPSTMKVGDASSNPQPHAITSFDDRWEWSAVNPNTIYYIKGNQLGAYNKSTGVMTVLVTSPDPLGYHVAVVGADAWVCAADGAGIQDTFTKIFCVNPSDTSQTKLIDVVAKTINGVGQTSANWPTSAAGATLGIHGLFGSAGGTWLGVNFHNQSWGGNGDSVLNLATNTWSLVTKGDYYWSGHVSLGNGKFVNGSGSVDGRDSRGAVVRDANDLMNSSKYQFIAQPSQSQGWNDAEHNSWFNSSSNPNAPVLFSRYGTSSTWQAWMSEIDLAATDGSNTVWRIAHTYNSPTGSCYYGDAFAQISNDGHWAIFSSPWGGALGGPGGFGCASRLDTFIVDLTGSSQTSSLVVSATPTPVPTPTLAPIQWTNITNSTLAGTSLTKTGGCDGCGDAGAISSQQITGDGYVEFTATETNTNRWLGLSATDPGLNVFGLNFALHLQAGIVEARENGVYKADRYFKPGDILRIAIVNGQIQYSINGQVFYSSSLTPSGPMRVTADLSSSASTIGNAIVYSQ